jgi:molybdopterin synthase sulfur carrier subunit
VDTTNRESNPRSLQGIVHIVIKMASRTITVLYFAAASTAARTTSETVELPTSAEPFRLSSLGALLAARHPDSGLGDVLESSQWSVDEEMVEEPDRVVLQGGEEVAVICPVSGG